MRRKYNDCCQSDGDCSSCHLSVNGKDCRGKDISKLELHRLKNGLSLKELSEKSSVNYRTLQKVERLEASAGNLTARNLIALAEALSVEPKELI